MTNLGDVLVEYLMKTIVAIILPRLVFTFIESVGLNHITSFPVLASFCIVAFKYWTVCHIVIESSYLSTFFYMAIIAVLNID